MVKRLNWAAFSVALVWTVASCGDDNETTATTEDAAAAQAEYCAIEAQVDALFNEAFSGTEPPTPEASAAVASQVLEEFGDKALAAAPEEIAADVAVLIAATEEMANGNPAAFDTPELQAAGTAVDEFCRVAP